MTTVAPGLNIAVVGGSLAGLAAARVLHAGGHAVTVFERAGAAFATRGGGLGIDLARASAVGGVPAPPHLRLPRRLLWRDGQHWGEACSEDVTAYGALWRWLCAGLPVDSLRHGREVRALHETAGAVEVELADRTRRRFDLVISADGGRGAGRAWVEAAPRPPRYAGYVLWRGLCPRRALAGTIAELDGLSINSLPGQHFVAYPIPTYEGAVEFASQLINWGWYRPTPSASVEALMTGAARDLVPHAFTNGPLPLAWVDALREALAPWPAAVRELVAATLAAGRVVPHPVHEVMPGPLARGRVALVGDVAHQASPITGAGARMAMRDALALADALAEHHAPEAALQHYARRRAADAAAVVDAGHQAGRRFASAD